MAKTSQQRWIAPPNGLYGVANERGFVSGDEGGTRAAVEMAVRTG